MDTSGRDDPPATGAAAPDDRRPARPRSRLMRPPGSWLALAACVAGVVAALLGAWLQESALDVVRTNAPFDDGWFLRPFEVDVAYRAPIDADLYAAATDGRRVWAAGTGPSIWHSADGGRTWAMQYGSNDAARVAGLSWLPIGAARAAQAVQAVQAPASAGYGQPAPFEQRAQPPAAQSTLPEPFRSLVAPLRSAATAPTAGRAASSRPGAPAGASRPAAAPASAVAPSSHPLAPMPIPEATPESALLAIHMAPDGLTGWAVGTQGRALRTVDGGAHWERRETGVRDTLRAVAFDSTDDVWIAGDQGQLLRSFDQGRHWKPVHAVDGQAGIHALALVDDKTTEVGLLLATDKGIAALRRDAAPPSPDTPWVDPSIMHSWPVVGLSASGGRGIAVSEHTVFAWQRFDGDDLQLTPTPVPLRAAAYAHGRGWAVGAGGLFRISLEPATPATPAASATAGSAAGPAPVVVQGRAAKDLRAIAFADDLAGWAVGDGGAVVATRDGGQTWQWLALPLPATGLPAGAAYRRFAPPWAIVLTMASLAGLAWVWRKAALRTPAQQEAARAAAARARAPGLAPDAPVADLRHDRLGHARTVRALDAFIRNVDTNPRLTIAITAPWGQGKSSVMRMLQTQLEANGYHSAWFNAWHHQQEGRPLSAMFAAIAAQALPRALPARWRLRARLIWMRGLGYRALVLFALLVAVVLVTDVRERLARPQAKSFAETAELKFAALVLDRPRVVLTTRSLDLLDPCAKAAPSAAASAAEGATARPAACQPCDTAGAAAVPARRASGAVRPAVWCYAKQHLQWQDDDGRFAVCRLGERAARCEFPSAEDLLSAVEDGAGVVLTPEERHDIAAAAEPMPAPELLPFTEKVVPVVLLVLGLLITKGVSVYGVELLKPLRALFSREPQPAEGKEATGAIERYRVEFDHLASALRGRLVIFIDDLDRCGEEMVNSVLEMSNYLIDVGDCYIVLGADLGFVKQCIRAPGAKDYDEPYANRYLRKLIHVELPVPQVGQAATCAVFEPEAPAAAQADGPSLWGRLGETVRRLLPLAGWLALAALVVLAGARLVDRYDSAAPGTALRAGVQFDLQLAGPPAASAAQGAAASGATATSTAASAAARPSPIVARALAATAKASPWGLLGALAFLALIALWAAWVVLNSREEGRAWLRGLTRRVAVNLGGAEVVHDAKDVRDAMAQWHRVVYLVDPTPRGAKRFRNKARLFGMLLGEQFRAAQVPVHAVALVALNMVDSSLVKVFAAAAADAAAHSPEQLQTLAFSALVPFQARLSREFRLILSECIAHHLEQFRASPPDDELVAAFQAWAASIAVR